MFGPNVKADEREGVYYHHRETTFHEILKSLETVFVHKFGLTNYDILFITGSGTTANEIVIYSFHDRFTPFFKEAEFGKRLVLMSDAHQKQFMNSSMEMYPLYETSTSKVNIRTTQPGKILFLDMVSAFPYYLPPSNCSIFTTVSSKQLGAYPVLGIIGIRKDLDLSNLITQKVGSSLSLKSHLSFREKNETLTTPSIPLYFDLLMRLQNFDRFSSNNKIDQRHKKITHIIGIDNVSGSGPVITFKENNVINNVANQFGLYKGKTGYQIFLWSGTDEEYDKFYEVLERAVKNG